MGAVLIFILSLAMSFVLIPICKRYSNFLGLVDKPSTRKVHKHVIPRSGGLAISLAVLLPLLFLLDDIHELSNLILGSIIIVLFGLADDKYELSYKWKFLGQVIAIIVFMVGAPEYNKLPFDLGILPEWITYTIIFIFILGATNAVNLSDGLDGLAAGTILLGLGFIAYLAYEAKINSVFILSCGLIGALSGFLRYNTHPASIFMGDTGSQFIGYMSATLAIIITQSESSASSPLMPLLILGLPLLDTIMVMCIRISQGNSPFKADRNHIHHQLIKFGFHHYETVAVLYFLQIALILSAYSLRHSEDLYIILFFLFFALVILSCIFVGQKSNWQFRDLGNIQNIQNKYERRNLFLRRFNWIYDYSSLLIAILIGTTWITLATSVETINNSLIKLSQVLIILFILAWLLLPMFTKVLARIGAYSVSVLTLYPYSMLDSANFPGITISIMFSLLSIVLIISIRITRREKYHLNNQDILIFFMLITAPLLPKEVIGEINMGTMLLQLAILLYSAEYLISKTTKSTLLLNTFSLLTPTILLINHSMVF